MASDQSVITNVSARLENTTLSVPTLSTGATLSFDAQITDEARRKHHPRGPVPIWGSGRLTVATVREEEEEEVAVVIATTAVVVVPDGDDAAASASSSAPPFPLDLAFPTISAETVVAHEESAAAFPSADIPSATQAHGNAEECYEVATRLPGARGEVLVIGGVSLLSVDAPFDPFDARRQPSQQLMNCELRCAAPLGPSLLLTGGDDNKVHLWELCLRDVPGSGGLADCGGGGGSGGQSSSFLGRVLGRAGATAAAAADGDDDANGDDNDNHTSRELRFNHRCSLRGHSDWVRCVGGMVLGGKDSKVSSSSNFSGDGAAALAFSSSRDGNIAVWHCPSLGNMDGWVRETTIYDAHMGEFVNVIAVPTETSVVTLPPATTTGPTAANTTVAAAAAGMALGAERWFASGGDDALVKLWDLDRDFTERDRLRGLNYGVTALGIGRPESSSSFLVAAGSSHGMLAIWDLRRGGRSPVARIETAHHSEITSAAFGCCSSNSGGSGGGGGGGGSGGGDVGTGFFLVTSGTDGYVRGWDMRTGGAWGPLRAVAATAGEGVLVGPEATQRRNSIAPTASATATRAGAVDEKDAKESHGASRWSGVGGGGVVGGGGGGGGDDGYGAGYGGGGLGSGRRRPGPARRLCDGELETRRSKAQGWEGEALDDGRRAWEHSDGATGLFAQCGAAVGKGWAAAYGAENVLRIWDTASWGEPVATGSLHGIVKNPSEARFVAVVQQHPGAGQYATGGGGVGGDGGGGGAMKV